MGIANGYGLDGAGFEFRWERDFPHTSRPVLRLTQLSTHWVPDLSRPGRGVDHLPQSRSKVKERVELYIYNPSGPSCSVMG